MIKLAIGAFAAAVAMFITGFIFFATPLGMIAYSSANETQTAAVQAALGANLPQTGTYMVPDPSTQSGTTLYGQGPVATVHYNSMGFSLSDMSGIGWGFLQELIVCLILAGALSHLDRRIPDFASRARIVVLFSVAASGMINLGNPVWLHHDWSYWVYCFVADAAMLIAAGLVIARWFLPVAAEMPMPSVVQQPQKPASSEEIGTA
jgi:hypothetical protein